MLAEETGLKTDETHTSTIECPTSTSGILKVLEQVLSHNVTGIRINPGGDITVDWVKLTSGEDLFAVPVVTSDAVLETAVLEQGEDDGSYSEQLVAALLEFTYSGLAANNLLVGSISEFKKKLNIPRSVRLPGATKTEMSFAGIRVLELPEGRFAEGHHVLLAGPIRTENIGLNTNGIILTEDD